MTIDELGPAGGDEDRPIDLGRLRLEGARHEALAARIEAAAAPALARRALSAGVQQTLARAAWPALLAAAAALLAAVGLGDSGDDDDAQPSLAVAGIERIVPGATADVDWIEEQRAPTNDDLVQAIGLGVTQ
jgi:hypothetical protein